MTVLHVVRTAASVCAAAIAVAAPAQTTTYELADSDIRMRTSDGWSIDVNVFYTTDDVTGDLTEETYLEGTISQGIGTSAELRVDFPPEYLQDEIEAVAFDQEQAPLVSGIVRMGTRHTILRQIGKTTTVRDETTLVITDVSLEAGMQDALQAAGIVDFAGIDNVTERLAIVISNTGAPSTHQECVDLAVNTCGDPCPNALNPIGVQPAPCYRRLLFTWVIVEGVLYFDCYFECDETCCPSTDP